MRFLGIDYGKKRVGISLSDEEGKFAMAHVVLQNDSKLLSELKRLIAEKKVEAIVVGESKNFKGEENPIMASIREFAELLTKGTSLPVHFEPEFMTSAEAEHIQGKNDMLDASAAAIILQSYLDRIRNRA